MQFPAIHLNGTSADSLKEPYREAYSAIGDAITKLAQCAPHGRDYYVISSDAINTAMAEHRARLAALTTVQNDMLAIFDAIEDQQLPLNH